MASGGALRLLLSNDDGIDARGLAALADHLGRTHEVWVVAPLAEQSAQSHSLTMHVPLRTIPRGPQRWAITGTPADCIYVAVHHLLAKSPPDLVVCGINHGANLGTDVHYSGTVAGAREACLQGYAALAVSLHYARVVEGGAVGGRDHVRHWDTACDVAERIVAELGVRRLPPGVFLNANVPNVEPGALRGLKACRLGDRIYGPLVDERIDPRGRPYLWIGGPHLHFGEDPDGDGVSIEQGWATVSPLAAAITSESSLPLVRAWTDA